mmetsp:Transcript_23676/g.53843  ORF Transcript_23676/g.53843 Transcript_23676/m.53843 type:complete len:206 (+) Transcript_23676:454-1071(+)
MPRIGGSLCAGERQGWKREQPPQHSNNCRTARWCVEHDHTHVAKRLAARDSESWKEVVLTIALSSGATALRGRRRVPSFVRGPRYHEERHGHSRTSLRVLGGIASAGQRGARGPTVHSSTREAQRSTLGVSHPQRSDTTSNKQRCIQRPNTATMARQPHKVKEHVHRDRPRWCGRTRRKCGNIHKGVMIGLEPGQSQVLATELQS